MRRQLRHRLTFFRILILIACLGLIFAFTIPARAHANLVRSDPETGAVLAHPPGKVTLEFSEPLDPSFSKARLADANLATVVEGPGVIDPTDNHILTLDLPPLSTGAYNVIWQSRSAIDSHISTGVVTFSVGNAERSISLLPQPGAPDPAKVRPPWMDTLLRWLAALSAALSAGSLLFALLVWRPAYRAWDSPEPRSDQIAGQRLRALSLTGAAGLAVVSLALVIFQAWQVSKGVFQVSISEALRALLGLPGGWVFWLRIAVLILLLFISYGLSRPGEGPAARWRIAALLALAVLLTISLQSHAAATDSPLPVLSDWVHLMAMAAWLGGLPALFILLRQTKMPAQKLVPKFSRLALVSVAVLALSGLYNASVHVRTLQALLDTIYGEAIAGKTILFFILFCIGAINLLFLSPRLSGSQQALRRLGITVRFEMAIGVLLLLLVALLTGVSPAYEALQARQRLGYIGGYSDNGVGLELWIAPTRVGENEVAVIAHGLHESPGGSPPEVLLRFQPTNVDLGEFQVDTVESSPSRFTARGSYLTIAGDWRVQVILRRAGANDVTHDFIVQVQPNPYLTDIVNPVPSNGNSISVGKTLYESDCLACHGLQGKGDGPAGLALRPPPADLTIHTAPGVHPDGQLFEWITNGYPGSAMPAFAGRLSDVERWNLVNYIRTLSRK